MSWSRNKKNTVYRCKQLANTIPVLPHLVTCFSQNVKQILNNNNNNYNNNKSVASIICVGKFDSSDSID